MKEAKTWKESEKSIEAEIRVGSSLPTGEAVEWRVFRIQQGTHSIVTSFISGDYKVCWILCIGNQICPF